MKQKVKHVLVIGGSGAGKTFYYLKGNLMQQNSSFIINDPKGEILRAEDEMLKNNGYNVKVINLLEMEKSNCYNPFSYIREETDVVKRITNLMSNTTPNDPFWDKAESMFLQALFYYVLLEMPVHKRNFASVLSLMNEAEKLSRDTGRNPKCKSTCYLFDSVSGTSSSREARRICLGEK